MTGEREDLSRAQQLIAAKDYASARDICTRIIAKNPDNVVALQILGIAHYLSGDAMGAAAHLRRAHGLLPRDKNVLYNLAIACDDTGALDEAIKYYRALLALEPAHVKALQNLGLLLVKTGAHDEAMQTLRAAMKVAPTDTLSASLLLECECQHASVPKRLAVCDEISALPAATGELRYTALIHRAITQWILDEDIAQTLAQAAAAKPRTLTEGVRNMGIFETFLSRLAEYKRAHVHIYGAAHNEMVAMVGDSHCLSHANTVMNGKKVKAHIIVGTKAWHIAEGKPSARVQALAAYIASLPEGAELICAFGEIDCRTDTGILPHWKKSGGTLEDIVRTQATAYVQAIARMTALRNIRPTFLGIPAPRRESGDRRQVVELYNNAMAKAAQDAGLRILDTYAQTRGEDGYGREETYIDLFHLNPGVLKG